MRRSDLDVLVIGAGVSGLTSAILLAESGLRVRVWSARRPEETTSVAAGAMWGPYLVEPVEHVRRWSARSLVELKRLAASEETGVRLTPGIEASRSIDSPPDWADQLDGFQMCGPDELPEGFVTGWRFVAPLVDMPQYLVYLENRFIAAGGGIELRRMGNLDNAIEAAAVVVNCSGLGAKELVPDPEMTAIRGQLVVVENPGITEFFSENTGMSQELLHIYPHGKTAVLGGLAVLDDWNLEPDDDAAKAIVARCAEVDPRLRNVRVIGHRVGLRPTRPRVRMETEQLPDATVVHNYGHGGAGVTLSWGCAADVVDLVNSVK